MIILGTFMGAQGLVPILDTDPWILFLFLFARGLLLGNISSCQGSILTLLCHAGAT